jgi:hypothetical protein
VIRPILRAAKNFEFGRIAVHVMEQAVANYGDSESMPPQAKTVFVVDEIHEEIGAR